MTRYIDTHRDRFGVEPICRALQVAPSTYYATKRRPPSARAVRDAELAPKIQGWARAFGIGVASVEEIDRINIFHASHLAMHRAAQSALSASSNV